MISTAFGVEIEPLWTFYEGVIRKPLLFLHPSDEVTNLAAAVSSTLLDRS